MKKIFQQGLLAAFACLIIFLWSRFFFDILTHPGRAFRIIALPSLCLFALIWIGTWFVNQRRLDKKRPAHIGTDVCTIMREKTTEELLSIVYGSRASWTDVAVAAANEVLKDRLFTASGIDALARYKAEHFTGERQMAK